MSMPSGMELLVILGIIVLLFGAKKIPDLAKGIGQGIKNFKKEMSEDTVETAQADVAKKVEGSEESATHTKTTTHTQA